MILQNIYEKDITRHINPAVVVSELEENKIEQEIGEYVFTQDIVKNLYKFLNAITNKKEGKTGVWISGYYGSGKSHFIKYLFYCLNKETRVFAFDRFKKALTDLKLDDLSEVTLSNVQLIQNSLDKTDVNEIIFNVDAVSGTVKNNNTITRILFNQLNAKRGYNTTNIAVALLIEKHFDQKGLFQTFKEKVKEVIGEDWHESKIRDIIRMRLAKVIDIAYELDATIDKDALRNAIKEDQDYRIDELIQELKDYVESKGANHKLIFLMDEVSQYIGGNTDLLLNLQTIVEEIGSKIGNKVWIVCTAQQDLKNLVNNTDRKSEDFGKIMGRFETMISLDSQDAAYITQKRILEKNEEGLKALVPFFKENKGAIENQFVFDHDLYNNYKNAEDFYLSYPFVPYQFRLISDVFQSFSTVGYVGEGVKNTERAILGITHYTAEKQKLNELGYFISFDNFFNDQFSKNLTHAANSILNKALQIQFDGDLKPFADRVIKVLFMISNLTEDTSVNLPATIENLTLLLLNNVNEVKINLQEKVQKVLDILVDKNIIQVSEGKYKFLDDEGIKVANAISDAEVKSNSRLTYFFDSIIKKVVKPDAAINLGNRTIKAELAIDDKILVNGDAFKIKFMVFEAADIHQLAMTVASNELCININHWFHQQNDFKKDFFTYCKTAQYLSDNRASATGTRAKTLEEFHGRNEVLLKDLIIRFEKLFASTPFISNQNVVDASDISSSSPAQRFTDMVAYHIQTLYKNHAWSANFAQSNNDLQEAIKVALIKHLSSLDFELNVAEKEVNSKIEMLGNEVSLAELVKMFEKAPYGWKDLATLHIVFNLAHKKHRQIEYQNEILELKDFYAKAINSRDREAIIIKNLKAYNQEEVAQFKNAVKDIFITLSFANSAEVTELVKQFKEALAVYLKEANQYKEEFAGYPFAKHFNNFHTALREIYETRSEEKVMTLVSSKQKELKAFRDVYVATKEFVDSNFESYNEMRNYVFDNKQNIEKVDLTDDLQTLIQYFQTEDQPGDSFPIIRKTNKKIKQALENRLTELKAEVIALYEAIFNELDAKKQELNITEPHIIADRATIIGKLEKAKQVSELEISQLKATDFKLDNLKVLQDASAKKVAAEKGETYVPKTIHTVQISSDIIAGNTIETPEQVDALVEKLRNKLMVELSKNGKIFLK